MDPRQVVVVRGAAAGNEAQAQVLLDRHLGEDVPALRNECDAGARDRLRRTVAEAAGEPDVSAGRADDAHDREKRRRLAGAVRPDQPDHLARSIASEAPHRRHRAVADVEAVELEHGPRLTARVRDGRAATEVRVGDVEVRPDVGRRPLRELPPLVENDDPVAHVHDQRHVVVDQEHARVVAVADGADDVGEIRHLRLGQPCRRLVHQHEARPGRERARDAELSRSRRAGATRGLARRGARAREAEQFGGSPRATREARRKRAPRPRRSPAR